MQKLHTVAGILLLCSIAILSGCKKECGCTDGNRIDFEGNSVVLDKAILENWGEYTQDEPYQGNRLVVGAFSPEVRVHYAANDVDSLSGRGHGIVFELFSGKSNNFAETVFIYSADHHAIGTFSFGLVYYDFLFESDDWLQEQFINSGTLSLSATDGKLVLGFNGNFETGEAVSAYYEGAYDFLEVSE
jgi:hypothetical protein